MPTENVRSFMPEPYPSVRIIRHIGAGKHVGGGLQAAEAGRMQRHCPAEMR